MFSIRRFHLCDMFGIPLYVDVSFAVLLAIFALSAGSLFAGLADALMLAISVVLHECGHALAARAFGYGTRDITISLIGGCASLIALPRKAWQELVTAIAGPLVSFALAAASFFLLARSGVENEFLQYVFWYMMVLNLMLGLFNLLPALPMDGGRVFKSVLRYFTSKVKATYIAMWVGRVLAIALVVLPELGVNRIWIIPIGGSLFIRLLIAWMIWTESRREYILAAMEGSWRRWDQGDFRAKVSPPPYDE